MDVRFLAKGCLCLVFPLFSLCARPYSGRVQVAPETLLQAADRGLDYTGAVDRAIDGPEGDLLAFIRLGNRLDSAGRYFHGLHVFEVAELVRDARFSAALAHLSETELAELHRDLAEAAGWIRRPSRFRQAFQLSTAVFERRGIKVDF
ncbi:MAG TPA: hypothetical protein PKI36_02365 [Turneriella sp.]|nr:hypothetical protein [Turneriella sp.]